MPTSVANAADPNQTLPVAVVLGAAVWQGGVASPTLQRRAQHAAQLYLDGTVGHIIACGGLGKHAPTEAKVICQICSAYGVPPGDITQENQSTTTAENIRLALPILNTLAAQHVVLVTDLYHAPRATMMARHLGLKARSASPSLQGRHAGRLLRSVLREIPAYGLYALRLWRDRITGSRSH